MGKIFNKFIESTKVKGFNLSNKSKIQNKIKGFDTNKIYFEPNYELSKREQKFKEILEKSREIFAKYGYKKTSIDFVAKAVKLQKGSLYYYFKSKEELFFEVIRYESFSFVNTITDIVGEEKTAKDKLQKYLFLRLDLLKKLKNIYSISESILGSMFPFMLKLKKEFFDMEKGFIMNILDQGIKSDEFKINDLDFVAIGIMGSLRGVEQLIILSDQYDKLSEDKFSELINILFNGICKQ